MKTVIYDLRDGYTISRDHSVEIDGEQYSVVRVITRDSVLLTRPANGGGAIRYSTFAKLRDAGVRMVSDVEAAEEKRRREDQAWSVLALDELSAGDTFRLGADAGRAYRSEYVKNADGTFDQIQGTCEAPHVVNMSASHLGYCVSRKIIARALGIEVA